MSKGVQSDKIDFFKYVSGLGEYIVALGDEDKLEEEFLATHMELYVLSLRALDLADMADEVLYGDDFFGSVNEFLEVISRLKSISKNHSFFDQNSLPKLLNFLNEAESFALDSKNSDILNMAIDSYLDEIPSVFEEGKKNVKTLLSKRGSLKHSLLKKYLKSSDFSNGLKLIKSSISEISGINEDDVPTADETADQKISVAFFDSLDFLSKMDFTDNNIYEFGLLCTELKNIIGEYRPFSSLKKLGKSLCKLEEVLDMLSFFSDLYSQEKLLQSWPKDFSEKNLSALASLLTVICAIKNELKEEIEKVLKKLKKKNRFFEIKKKNIKIYEDFSTDI